MTTSAGEVRLDLTANTKPFERTANAATDRFQGMFSKLGTMAGKLLAVAALAKFGKEAIEVASALTEVQNVVDVTFPHMNQQLETWAQEAADAFGMSELMAKKFSSRLGSMAEATGFSEAAAYEMGTALTQLAGDVASFYDIDHEEAYNKLTSVFTGATRPMMDLGVVMSQVNLDAFALEQGLGKTTAQMSATEKATLRYEYVLHSLSNTQGDFARTSGSWANQVRLLTLRFAEFKAAVGQSLIAVLLPVVKVLNAIIAAATMAARAFSRVIEAITGRSMGELTGGVASAGVAVGDLGGAAGGAADSTDDLANAQGNAAKAAKAQEKAQKDLNRTLAGFDRINKLASNSDNLGAGSTGGTGGSLGGAGTGIEALGGVADAAEEAQNALDKLVLPENLIKAFERLKKAVSEFTGVVSEGLKWAYDNVLVPLGKWTINTVVPDAVTFLAESFENLTKFAKDCAKPLQTIATTIKDGLMWGYENVLQPLGTWFNNSVMPRVLESVSTTLSIISNVLVKLKPVFEGLWAAVSPFIDVIGDVFVWGLDRINDALSELDKFTSSLNLEPIGDWLKMLGENAEKTAKSLKPFYEEYLGPAAEQTINNFVEQRNKEFEEQSAWLDALVKKIKDAIDWWKKLLGIEDEPEQQFGGDDHHTWGRSYINESGNLVNETSRWDEENGRWVTEVEIRARNATQQGVLEAQQELGKVPTETKTKLNSDDQTQTGITGAGHRLAQFAGASWIAKLTSKDETKGGIDSSNTSIKDKFNGKTVSLKAERHKSLWWSNTEGALRVSADLVRTKFNGKTVGLGATRGKSLWWSNTSGALRTSADVVRTKFNGKTVGLGARNETSSGVNAANKNIDNNFNPKRGRYVNLWVTPKFTQSHIKLAASGGGQMKLEAFATGGFVQRNTPQLAMVGDNRHAGEYILPENVIDNALASAGLKGAAQGGNANSLMPILQSILMAIQNNGEVYLDGKAISRNVVNHINQQVQSTGRSPLLV